MQKVRIRRLATGSIFKLVFLGSWAGSIPVFLLVGVLAASGVEILSWNGKYISGWSALVAGPVLGHWILSRGQGLRLVGELEELEAAGLDSQE